MGLQKSLARVLLGFGRLTPNDPGGIRTLTRPLSKRLLCALAGFQFSFRTVGADHDRGEHPHRSRPSVDQGRLSRPHLSLSGPGVFSAGAFVYVLGGT